MIQDTVFYVTLLLLAAFTAVFLAVVSRASAADDGAAAARTGGLRVILFWALIVGGAAYSFATLVPMPIPAQSGVAGGQTVKAVASQWSWDIEPATVQAGRPVEFVITSRDVNHGFGIYNEKMVLLTQTQAMPGYTNKVVHTFDDPGTYRILCLEYCGLAHHQMTAQLTVIPADAQPTESNR